MKLLQGIHQDTFNSGIILLYWMVFSWYIMAALALIGITIYIGFQSVVRRQSCNQ